MHDSFLLPYRETVLYGRSCNNHFGFTPSEVQFLGTVEHIFTYAKTFVHNHAVSISDVRNNGIAENPQRSNFLHEDRPNKCSRHVGIPKCFIRCPVALSFVEKEAADIFGITHLQAGSIVFHDQSDAVVFLRVA